MSAALRAQGEDAADTQPVDNPVPHETRTHEPTRFYFAMGTVHLKETAIVFHNNWVAGMSGRGFFGATFLNSYGRRAVTGGIQRTIVSTVDQPLTVALSFRLGFVTGYDGRLMRIARKTPVLPLVQPVVTVDVWHIGVEVSYTFVVLSTALSYRF